MQLCPKCSEREVMAKDQRWCRECRNAYHKAWHWKHREKCVVSMRERRLADPIRHKAYLSTYAKRWPERLKEQQKRSNEKRRAEMQGYRHRRYWSDPEKWRRYHKEWARNNPERSKSIRQRTYLKNRDSRIAQNRRWKMRRFFYQRARRWQERHGYAITPITLWGIWKRQRGLCALTGRRLDGRSTRAASLDHILARGNGGRGDPVNLRWVCYEANVAKGVLSDSQLFGLCEEILDHRRKTRPMLSDYVDGMQHLAGVML